MDSVSAAAAVGQGFRTPFWLVGTVLAVIWTLVFGALSALWYFVVLPLLWVVFGVPVTFVAVSFSGRRGIGRRLRRRLSHTIDGWRSSWRYHFRELVEIFRSLNRWWARGSTRRY